MTLPVHEEDQQRVIYREGCAQTAVENPPQSPLMAYFEEAKKSKEELEEKYNNEQNNFSQSELEEMMEKRLSCQAKEKNSSHLIASI